MNGTSAWRAMVVIRLTKPFEHNKLKYMCRLVFAAAHM
jgi:hypothetical protein